MDDINFPGWQPEKSIQVMEDHGRTRVLVRGQPYMRWRSGDEPWLRLAIVQLYACRDLAGAATVAEHQAEMEVLEPPPVQYADSAYISAQRLAQAQAEGWELIGPALAPPDNEGRFTSEAFQIEVEKRRAICPAGKENTRCGRIQDESRSHALYRFEWTHHCQECPLRARCVRPGQAHRILSVGEHHSLLQARRQEQKTESFRQRYQQRRPIEGTISELKRGHGLGRARYRGLPKVSLQAYLIGAACNLKRWINQVVWDLRQGLVPAPVAVPSG